MVADTRSAKAVLLAVRGLTLRYMRRSILGSERIVTTALDDVSVELRSGKTMALVGPSGSGKSSLARCLVLLERPTSGEILYRGKNLLTLTRKDLKTARREIHLIFQDSALALNPGLAIGEILREPLDIHESGIPTKEKQARIRQVIEQVQLPEMWLNRRPLDLSGGQRQRVAIARSLILQPKLLILDEALSGLDLSTRGQIANLLLDLQRNFSLTYLLVTHDVSMAAVFAHEVALMDAGRIAPKVVFQERLNMSPESAQASGRC
jgi:ABC-type glutathione transport system ATPase component